MNNIELSYEFDVMFNNITSNQAPGLTAYEKSIFLSNVQEMVVKGIYNGTLSSGSFESTEESRTYLNNLVRQVLLDSPITESLIKYDHIVPDSIFYQLPNDLMFITYESVIIANTEADKCMRNKYIIVKPVTQDMFWEWHNSPFKCEGKTRVLRLTKNNTAELVSRYDVGSYSVRYIKKPSPIILEDATYNSIYAKQGVTYYSNSTCTDVVGNLSIDTELEYNPDNNYGTFILEDVTYYIKKEDFTYRYDWSIDGQSTISECELHPALHRVIVEYAVKLAQQAWFSINK